MENVRKYQDVKLMKMNNERDEKAFLKKVSKPSLDKTTQSKHKGVSKKGMGEMAEKTYPESESPMTQVYRDCLFGNKVFYAKNVGIRSKDHVLFLVESEKKALCPIDTKRWILTDGICSIPFWHCRTNSYN